MHRSVVIYGNALDDAVRRNRRVDTDSPAATRKIVGMARALETAGIVVEVVSLGRGRSRGIGYHPSTAGEIDAVPIRYLPFLRFPLLSQAWSTICLMLAAMAAARRHVDAVHLFYNRLSLYLLAFLALRIMGRRVALDIEDGPVLRSAGQPATGLSNGPARLFDRLTNGGALLANAALARSTEIRPVIPYYGVVGQTARTTRDWSSEPFELLLGGSLFPDTGCELLAEACDILAKSDGASLRIHVTGKGPSLALFEAPGRVGARIEVEVHRRLDTAAYRTLLERCHAGLSLKLIGSQLADSTFPSKTIEYAEYGVLIIATDISDVRAVFGESVLYLTQDDPAALAELIELAARDRRRSRSLAEASHALIGATLSVASQGSRLADFLFEEAA